MKQTSTKASIRTGILQSLVIILMVCMLTTSIMAATPPKKVNLPPNLVKYSTSWLGNSFGSVDEKWVQNEVLGFYVKPDGTCYANSYWDEEGR